MPSVSVRRKGQVMDGFIFRYAAGIPSKKARFRSCRSRIFQPHYQAYLNTSIKRWILLCRKMPDSHCGCLAFFVCATGLPAGYAPHHFSENLEPIFKFLEVAKCVIRLKKFFWTFFLKGKVHLPFTLYPLFQRAKERGWTHELCRTAGSDSGSAVHKAARYIPQPGIWISGFERNHPAGYSRPHVFLPHRNGARSVWAVILDILQNQLPITFHLCQWHRFPSLRFRWLCRRSPEGNGIGNWSVSNWFLGI